ncbi:MAG: hypothetical protein FD152_541 [Xanthobacteraceae bacterium]|nr:MAG: hypothetical protein FD152_541 [Xanthobacteraceae bacterium]
MTALAEKVEALNRFDREVLEMVDGKRPGEWGAWVAATLEGLHERGMITAYVGAVPTITAKGRRAMENDNG